MADLVPVVQLGILEVRGQKVMLDSDLASLYGVETRVLLQQIKRNGERFPADFMFQLEDGEWESLRSQIVISKPGRGGRRSRPYAFTEHGVAMLSSVLRSERAIAVNIEIMRAFVAMRRGARDLDEVARRLDDLERLTGAALKAHEKQLAEIFVVLRRLTEPPARQRRPVGFRIPEESD